MALRKSTIENSLNRRRFVTPAMAQPYLNKRARANLQRIARRAQVGLARAVAGPHYGTVKRLHAAYQALRHAKRWVTTEEQLAAVPPPGEATQAYTTLKLAAD